MQGPNENSKMRKEYGFKAFKNYPPHSHEPVVDEAAEEHRPEKENEEMAQQGCCSGRRLGDTGHHTPVAWCVKPAAGVFVSSFG